jgi:hypothetical protein
MCVMRILPSLWKEIPHARRHSALVGQLLQTRRVQACRDQPGGVEFVQNIFLCAFRLCSEVNHSAAATVETVFSTRRRAIDCDLGIRAQNPADCQNLAFRCALKSENIGVLAFESGEFAFG